MTQRKRANEFEHRKRLDMMLGLLARGLSTTQLMQITCQQWEISERQALRYLKEAKEQECKLIDQPANAHFGRILQRLNYISEQALLSKDFELARRTEVDIKDLIQDQLKGRINDPSQSHHSGFVEPGELEELIRSLGKTGENPSA